MRAPSNGFKGLQLDDAEQLESPAPGRGEGGMTKDEANPRFIVTSPTRAVR
jgi:hypothetical protein